ncbi:MAG TPA: molybdate ABC transporter substrate-binding protein [Cytophagaceae bacterium]|jgi:molybdate transport system substrate-binding protein|nr:molybdate ABC transporter substrate-binding protein [Cytophagaceae bacterium]
MKKILLLTFVFVQVAFNLFGQEKLTIAVAANAQYAMKAIEKQYEKETGKEIDLIIGSSGKLTAQIREGAPFDLFLSADMEFPQALYKENLTTSEPQIYAYGSLVLWTCKDIDLLNVNVLLIPEVQVIAIANPKVAPYGEAAVDVMKYYKVYDKVESKLVYGESISQVNQYITSKAATIGFTAKSVVLSPEMKDKGKWMNIDKKAYQPIAQGIVILNYSLEKHKTDAELFYNYLLSEKARKTFSKYGYQFSK